MWNYKNIAYGRDLIEINEVNKTYKNFAYKKMKDSLELYEQRHKKYEYLFNKFRSSRNVIRSDFLTRDTLEDHDKSYNRFSANTNKAEPFKSRVKRGKYNNLPSNNMGDILCSYCNMDMGREMDHFLPKSVFYMLAIEPFNLVPCCSVCNRKKLDKYEEYDFFHPYFPVDDSDIGRWLKCTVKTPEDTIDIFYDVASIESYQGEDKYLERINQQFTFFDLSERFQYRAISELGGFKNAVEVERRSASELLTEEFREIFSELSEAMSGYGEDQKIGTDSPQDYVMSELIRDFKKYGPNHWRVALYAGLAANPNIIDLLSR